MRVMMLLLTLPAVLLMGCGPAPAPAVPAATEQAANRFDKATAGDVQGQITWAGPIPAAAPIRINPPGLPPTTTPNPHQPVIHKDSRGLAGVLVYLKGIEPSRARSWDHAAVAVVSEKGGLRVEQGTSAGIIGLVRQGDHVSFEQRDATFISMRCRGAAFCSLPFVRPGATRRSLSQLGHVQITTASGDFWKQAHLFVSDHPYVCITDAEGRFKFSGVPEGDYEVHCWLPHWEIEDIEHDPELRQPSRLVFRAPLTERCAVAVRRAETTTASVAMGVPE